MARQDPQINIRLTDEENEILEAAGWVKRSGKTELAKAVVLGAITRYRRDPAVREALAARRAADRDVKSAVTEINPRGEKQRKRSIGSS